VADALLRLIDPNPSSCHVTSVGDGEKKELTLKVLDCSSRTLVFHAMSPALRAEKAKELTSKVRDCSNRIFVRDAMSPAAGDNKGGICHEEWRHPSFCCMAIVRVRAWIYHCQG
jgi:hypothetical protein